MDAVGWATIIGTAVAGASLYYTVRRIAGGALNSRNTSAASGSFAMGYKSQINVGTADQPDAATPADGRGARVGAAPSFVAEAKLLEVPAVTAAIPTQGAAGMAAAEQQSTPSMPGSSAVPVETQVKLMGGEVEPRRVGSRLLEGQRRCGYMAAGDWAPTHPNTTAASAS